MDITVRYLLLLLTTLMSFSAHGKVTHVTIYADNDYPPYSYTSANQPTGIYTDILKKAFSRMENYRVKIVPVPWKRGLSYLQNGKGFAIYPPYYRPQQRPYIGTYSTPILEERVVVFCTEETMKAQHRPRWPEDYYGLKIGTNSGFELGGDQFEKAVQQNLIQVQKSGGNQTNLIKLGLGRINCYMNDRISILFELKQLINEGKYSPGKKHARFLEGATVTEELGYLGFSNQDNNLYPFKADFIKQFNQIIDKMKERNEIQPVIDRYTSNPQP